MTTMISEVYDALKDATGVSDEKARKAAEAVAQVDARFFELKTGIEALRGETKTGFETLRGEAKIGIETLRGETKASIDALRAEMNVRFERVEGKLAFDRWVLLLIVGGIVTLMIKAFF
jgi:hypothetical protein